MNKILVSPSILNCNFAILGDECKSLQSAGADWIHCDVMDGDFVPNISFGAPIIKCIDKVVDIPLDVHLMISEPEKYVEDFAKAGADLITFHFEATKKIDETINKIKACGVKVGLSIKPNTSVQEILPYLNKVDLILVMSVEPGFGGQKFMPNSLEKIAELKKIFDGYIEVDGGINGENIVQVLKAGANVIVAGSYIINANDRKKAVDSLR